MNCFSHSQSDKADFTPLKLLWADLRNVRSVIDCRLLHTLVKQFRLAFRSSDTSVSVYSDAISPRSYKEYKLNSEWGCEKSCNLLVNLDMNLFSKACITVRFRSRPKLYPALIAVSKLGFAGLHKCIN